jgi:hypothetical protein
MTDPAGLDFDESTMTHEPPLSRLAMTIARLPGVRHVSLRDGRLEATVDDEAAARVVRGMAPEAEVRVG